MRGFLLSAIVALSACAKDDPAPDLAILPAELDQLTLPEGFQVSIYADGVPNARAMARGDDGTIFVGSRGKGLVHAIRDEDGDHYAERVWTIAKDLNMPTGIAYRDGALYVAAVSRILRFDQIEDQLDSPPEPVVVSDAFPTETWHGWKYLAFGPDGKLYVPVGAPCNVCLEAGYATIKRMNADGSNIEDFSLGVRNTVGFDWHPSTQELWFTDNGRDHLGDDVPPCELNHAPRQGMHFGFPHCHGQSIEDPEFNQDKSCADFVAPTVDLGAHVAPLGMKFYTGNMFPESYRNQIFLAEHGSWNRSEKSGYQVSLVKLDQQGNVISYEPFITGWLQGQKNWGRPVDVLIMPDGALLISDDQGGRIYRVSYHGKPSAT